jgi:hypothetical protein
MLTYADFKLASQLLATYSYEATSRYMLQLTANIKARTKPAA